MGANEEVRLHRKEHELARAKDRKEYEMSRRIETEARFAAATARRDARTRGDARAREGELRATYNAEYDANVARLTSKKAEETEETLRRKRDAVARGRLREERLKERLGPVKAGVGPVALARTLEGTAAGGGGWNGAGERPTRDFLISGPLKAPGEGTRVHRTMGPDGTRSVEDAHLSHG